MTPAGFPHSDILGSTSARDSPGLNAACHVLHRLLAPRHPPRALCSLTSTQHLTRRSVSGVVDRVLQLSRRSDLSIFFTAVIYPVVKVHRRSGSRPALSRSPSESAGLWAQQSERTDQGRSWARTSLRASGQVFDLKVGIPSCSRQAKGGGDEETRTPDPLLAKEMLCQLSYVPSATEWWAFLDSNQRPLPYQGSALTS